MNKKEGKYPYFVSLFHIVPYDDRKKTGENLLNFQGGGEGGKMFFMWL